MFNRLFSSLYPKVFINIVLMSQKTMIYAEINSKNSIIDSDYKVFDTIGIDKYITNFIEKYKSESPFFYVSILDNSSYQGAICSCNANIIAQYCDLPTIEYKCFKKNSTWAYYSSKYELGNLQHTYKQIGLDFIFSPFALMAEFFKDKISMSIMAYVLIEERFLSFAIFENSKLLFAEHLDLEKHKELTLKTDKKSVQKEEELALDGLDIDGIDLDNMQEHNINNAIEELEVGDDLEEFASDIEPIYEDDTDIKEQDFGDDYERFMLIQNALGKFYKNSKYDSKFIETIFIADSQNSGSNLKNYIENELFLNVHSRKIDIALSLCDLAKAELNAL